ncbi:MAG: hypothetical protein MJ160_02030 [Treponema sp.]|nr:hypothetical protein [Treponema sp.]
MKKSVLLVLFVLFLAKGFSQEAESVQEKSAKTVSFWSTNVPDVYITQNVQYNLISNLKYQDFALSTVVQLDFHELTSSFGICQTGTKIDFSSETIYWPLFNKGRFNLGCGVIYHYYYIPDILREHDIQGGLYFRRNFSEKLSLAGKLTFFEKISLIPDNTCVLENHSVAVQLAMNWKFAPDFNAYISAGSNSMFDFPLTFSPIVVAGLEKSAFGFLTIGTNLSAEWIDLISAVSDVYLLDINVYAKIKL